jgi:hypothetical protein
MDITILLNAVPYVPVGKISYLSPQWKQQNTAMYPALYP